MARPRFHKLPPAEQQAIVRAAFQEFASYGFNAASLNRIIDAAGISKGSMYYYFDGKEDLYVHVARVALDRLFDAAGPFPVPIDSQPDAFWETLEDYYLRLMRALAASAQTAALARDWLLASGTPTLQQAQKEMEQASLPWFEQTLTAGRRVRAIRKDVPQALLIAVAFGMGQAMDAWLLTQQHDPKALRKLVRVLVGMIRRALEP
jgi:AcrR family transcriptional regulator